LYEAIVVEAQRHGLAGATIWKGTQGFDSKGLEHSSPLGLGTDLPAIVELVDTPAKIAAFLALIRPMIPEAAVVTVQAIDAFRFGAPPSPASNRGGPA
jgi:PII-like signaling protein